MHHSPPGKDGPKPEAHASSQQNKEEAKVIGEKVAQQEKKPEVKIPSIKKENESLFQQYYLKMKRAVHCFFKPNNSLIIIGAPASGKGTQCEKIKDEYCLCHISSGDLLRNEVAQNTELGKKAKDVMEKGGLVSDDLIFSIMEKAIQAPECKKGALFDGFPRTMPQVEKLGKMLEKNGKKLGKVISLEIPDFDLIQRAVGRRIHLASGRVYHVKNRPPKIEGYDDITHEPLVHRKDDTEEVMKNRLEQFHKNNLPIVDYYSKKNLIARVDAKKKVEEIWSNIKNIL